MEMHAPTASAYDYDFVEWSGRAPISALPATKSPPRDFDTNDVWLLTESQLRYWTAELGVTMYEIRDAIAATGTRCATAVRKYLGQ